MHRTRIEIEKAKDEAGKEILIEHLIHEYTTTCKFCGIETGHVSFRDVEHPGLNNDLTAAGIEDSRCGTCETIRGTYREEQEAEQAAADNS